MIGVHGNPKLVQGAVNKAIHLNGSNQYLDIGEHDTSCLGNLLYCIHGYTGSMWVKFPRFEENMYYLSTGENGVNLYYKVGRMKIKCTIPGREWQCDLPPLPIDDWVFLEFSWHSEDGLKVYVDNELAGKSDGKKVPLKNNTGLSHVYVGRANPSVTENGSFAYGDLILDDLETWYDRREDLVAFNYIRRGRLGSIYAGPDIPSIVPL